MIPQHELDVAEQEAHLDKLIRDTLNFYANTNSIDGGVLAQAALEAWDDR